MHDGFGTRSAKWSILHTMRPASATLDLADEILGGVTVAECPLDTANRALGLYEVAPAAAARLAESVWSMGLDRAGYEATALAFRVGALVERESGSLSEAERLVRASIRTALKAGLDGRVVEGRTTLMSVLAGRGDLAGAMGQIAKATVLARGSARTDLIVQEAHMLERMGRLEESLVLFANALRRYRADRDQMSEAQLLLSRGVVHAYRGAISSAEKDFARARSLARELGQDALHAKAMHNEAFTAGRAGDIAAALDRYAEVERDFRRLGMARAVLSLDRCEVLLSAGLAREARAAAERAATELEMAGLEIDHAEALLQVSRAALDAGDNAAAQLAAEDAGARFDRQRRPSWSALARLAALRAAFRRGERTPALLATARRVRRLLSNAGRLPEAGEAALIAGRIAMSLSRRSLARKEFELAKARHRGPLAIDRRAAPLAAAFLCLTFDDRPGAMRALRLGLRSIERERLLIGASELRSSSAASGKELASLGLRLALERGKAPEVFEWGEAWRSRSLAFPTVTPPADRVLARGVARLRATVARQEEASKEGRTVTGLAADRARLERHIVERTRRLGGSADQGTRPPTAREVREELDGSVLVELIRSDDRLAAVVVSERRTVLRDLGPAEPIDGDIGALSFALRRLAFPDWPDVLRASARTRAEELLASLGSRLIGPIAAEVGDDRLVVVPTGSFHAVPWGLLGGVEGRPVVVAPSAALWLGARRDHEPRSGRTVVAVGPDLPGGAREGQRIARLYPDADHLSAATATCEAVASRIAGASVAHVAAHGQARADNPLFSSLRLADGPLMVHELERLRPAPELFVLPACDGGAHEVGYGDEIQGLAAALLGLGSKTVITSIGLAPDEATGDLMVGLHRYLRAGVRPAEALSRAVSEVSIDDPCTALATKANFVCLGSG